MTEKTSSADLIYDYAADAHLISEEFRYALRIMEFQSRRMGGRDNARERSWPYVQANDWMAHDAWGGRVFGTSYYRCPEQSHFVLKMLHPLRGLRLKWLFILASKPGHYWVEAVPVVNEYQFTARMPAQWKQFINEENWPEGIRVLVLDPLWGTIETRAVPTANIEPHPTGNPTERVYF